MDYHGHMKKVAERTGVSLGTLHKIENGDATASTAAFLEVARDREEKIMSAEMSCEEYEKRADEIRKKNNEYLDGFEEHLKAKGIRSIKTAKGGLICHLQLSGRTLQK